jgi:hypothetical protein
MRYLPHDRSTANREHDPESAGKWVAKRDDLATKLGTTSSAANFGPVAEHGVDGLALSCIRKRKVASEKATAADWRRNWIAITYWPCWREAVRHFNKTEP